MTHMRALIADVGSYTRIAAGAAWYTGCDLMQATHQGFRRGWALGMARRVR